MSYKQEYEITFTTEEKTLKDGSKAVLLTDNKGYLCGIYETVAQAEKVIPVIRYNIERGKIPARLLAKPQNRPRTKQVSNKK